jgi:hypothetical protein
MSLSSLILKIDSLVQNPTLDRTIKAVIATVAAQGALYTTVIPKTPPLSTSGEIAGGVGVVVALISLLVTWAGKSQAKQAQQFAALVDAAAAKIVADQAAQAKSLP